MIAPRNEEKVTLKEYWHEHKTEVIVAGAFAIFSLIILNGLLSGQTDWVDASDNPIVLYLMPS